MLYGGSPYGSASYGSIDGGESPNAIIDLSALGDGGRFLLTFSLPDANVNGIDVNLADIPGTLLNLYFNKDYSPEDWFADAGELWKRVPLHSSVNYRP